MLNKRIKRGIVILDKHFPDWHYRVNLQELDMLYANCCILAQLCGEYDDGIERLGLSEWASYKHGFLPLVQVGVDLGSWFPRTLRKLTNAWKELIIQKRVMDLAKLAPKKKIGLLDRIS